MKARSSDANVQKGFFPVEEGDGGSRNALVTLGASRHGRSMRARRPRRGATSERRLEGCRITSSGITSKEEVPRRARVAVERRKKKEKWWAQQKRVVPTFL
jgi:hypothetical protein